MSDGADYLIQQLEAIRAEIAARGIERVAYRKGEVTAVAVDSFTADVGATTRLAGITAPPQFLPAVGDVVDLALFGATVLYLPGGIAENAIGFRELEPVVAESIEQAAENAQTAIDSANGKNRIFHATTIPNDTADPGTTVGDVWWQRNPETGVILGQWEWDGGHWNPVTLAGEMVAYLDAGRITTGTLAAGVSITVGDLADVYTVLAGEGLGAYADDPVDGIPNEVARFGGYSSGRDPITGQTTWSVDEQGRGSWQSGSFQELSVGGKTMDERDWERPWGLQGVAHLVTEDGNLGYWGAAPKTDTEVGLLEFAFTARPGRMYELSSEPFEVWADSGDVAYLRIRMTNDGSQPMVTTLWNRQVLARARTGFSGSSSFSAVFPGPTTAEGVRTYRMLFTYGTANGSKGVQLGAHGRFRFTINDIGPGRPDVGRYSTGGGAFASTQPPAPPAPPPAARTTRTDTWYANWTASYNARPERRTDVGSAMYQGYGDSYNGINAGAWGWPDLTGILAGADVHKVEFWLNCEHTWYGSGMTLRVGPHGHLAGINQPPAAWPGFVDRAFDMHFGRSEGRWFDLTAWAAGIKGGNFRGMGFNPGAGITDPQFYGRLTGVGYGTAPQIRVTYTR